jgi:CRP-like cAMP-binding protein
MTNEHLTALRQICNSFYPLKEEDWELFVSAFQVRKLLRGEHMVREGEISQSIFFIYRGAMRTFHLHDGEEINTSFNFENDFVCELESVREQTPSKNYISALEDCVLLVFKSNDMFKIYDQSSEVPKVGGKIIEQRLIQLQEYPKLLLNHSPQERYQKLLDTQPEVIKRVAVGQIASYLGMARETLSRIRSRVV